MAAGHLEQRPSISPSVHAMSGASCRLKRGRGARRLCLFLCIAVQLAAAGSRAHDLAGQAAERSRGPRTIVDLQPFRQTTSLQIQDSNGQDVLFALTDLNSHVNAWYILWINKTAGGPGEAYLLENANPGTQRLLLHESHPNGITIVHDQGKMTCDLWTPDSLNPLTEARASGVPYAPLCERKVHLRNPTKGHRTGIEAATDFLRDNVPGGEQVVTVVRDTFFAYLYQKKAEEKLESRPVEGLGDRDVDEAPAPAVTDPGQGRRIVRPVDLGLEIEDQGGGGMLLGSWYRAKNNPGIFVSVLEPKAIAREIMESYRDRVNGLDSVESGGLVYLVAFNLGQFDVKYALGTEHPRVDWSDHMLSQMRDPSIPGPDGIGAIAPLTATGLVPPVDAGRTAAVFTGGFKRTHSAFKYGPLALKNYGSHYGFLQDGVVFSTLQPGLSTLYVLNDGWADMKTWSEEEQQLLPRVRYARQNGVPLITEYDGVHRMSVPGPFVARWGEGNWSGSADKNLRTLRAGAALQESEGRRFLLYGFFWSATPSAMARVFQAYGCRYAMLLDMNALVHTYLAVYRRQGSDLRVQHLIRAMGECDPSPKGKYVPRFLGYPDDRDFFYLTHKERP